MLPKTLLLLFINVGLIATDKTKMLIDVLDSCADKAALKIVHITCSKSELVTAFKGLIGENLYILPMIAPIDSIPYYTPINKLIYVLDTTCDDSYDIIRKANDEQLFSSPYRWIFVTDDDFIARNLSGIAILLDSDVMAITKAPDDNRFDLRKIYKRRVNTEMIYEQYAIWEEGNIILEGKFEKNSAIRRRDLGGLVLDVGMVITHNESYQHLEDKRQKHIDSISKVNYVFMQHIGDLLNARMNYTFDGTWGYLGNDSKWTGLISKLVYKKVDIGGTPFFVTTDRISIVDYVAMTTATRSKFVFRQPKLSYITNVFTLPFETSVWASSLALVVITAFSLYIVIKWEWYKKRAYNISYDNEHLTDTELRDSFFDVYFLAFGAVCQQGASEVPFNGAGRVIMILLFISLMFLYTSYSANIVALLQSSSTSIQTLADLLQSRLQVGVDDTVFNHFYFPNASEPIRRALYLQKVAPPGQKARYLPIEEGVRRMREGLFAFHMETGAGYKIVGETFMEDEKCGLQEIQFLQVPDPWLALPKNSSLKETIKLGLRKILESGLQAREVSLIYTQKPQCISGGSSFIGVSIVDCYPAAVILFGGAFAAFCIFLLEILFHRFYHMKRNENVITVLKK